MKNFRLLFLSLILSLSSFAFAEEDDFSYQQERMKLDREGVYVVSSFENADVIAAYSYNGIRMWEAPFHAKIISWEIVDDQIFIFSKDRKGNKTYLDCLDKETGKVIWEKP